MISDEMLMAYVDGQALPDQALQVEAALEADVTLRARLDRMRGATHHAKAAFDALLDRPVPDRLLETLRAARAEAAAADAGGNVIPFKKPMAPARRWAWPAAAAASLLVGVSIGKLPLPQTTQPDWITDARRESPRAGAAIAAALSSTPSGVSAALSEGRKITPVLTFANRAGELCRQFTFIGPADRHSGLACRKPAGDWSLVALTTGEPVASGGDYHTAAGPGDDPVSAMTNQLIQGEPLDAAGEAAALGKIRRP